MDLATSQIVLSTKADTADQFLIPNQVTGALYCDVDGAGNCAAVQIVNFATTPTLDAGDFVLN
jgi:Ca2+-binding RTX toxin-like protein